MGGAEGKACVNLKRETTGRHLASVVSAMREEMACAYRAAQAFGLCHPILVGKRLDPKPGKVLFASRALDQFDQPLPVRLRNAPTPPRDVRHARTASRQR
jgi:hypothetical protein